MKTLIAVPCGDTIPVDFFQSYLRLEVVGEVQLTLARGSLVYDARNNLANVAKVAPFDRVLWLDSDMVFPPDLFKRLSAHLDAGKQMVSALYFARKEPHRPVAYKRVYLEEHQPRPIPHADHITELGKKLMQIEGCGFGAVMMTADLVRRVEERWPPFSPEPFFGEDLTFCNHVRELGETIWLDPTLSIGHVGSSVFTEANYKEG